MNKDEQEKGEEGKKENKINTMLVLLSHSAQTQCIRPPALSLALFDICSL